MSKPMLEKYEQMLAADPASTVFVELARAYLDRGDNDRAIQTCQQGVTHHPNSVVGRVLWGKALINTGKAADAMKQFDLAVNIDRENPHAYNLIGEALLRKGLYRSALPILRRAATLQPNDGRIAQWLEQTKQALAGGPAPVLYDSTSVDQQALAAAAAPAAPAPAAPAPAAAPVPKTPARAMPAAPAAPAPPSAPAGDEGDVFAGFAPARPDPDAQPTVLMGAYTPNAAAPLDRSKPPVPTGELPVVAGSLEDNRSTQELPAQLEAPDPFAAMSSASGEDPDTFRGLTSTFDALSSNASPEAPAAPPRPSGPSTEPSVVVQGAALSAPVPAPPVLQYAAPPAPAASSGGGILDDVVSAQSELPTSEFQMPGMNQNVRVGGAAARPAPPKSSGGLLDEIPDESLEPPSTPSVPSVQLNTQATEAIAKEYERELRAKLEVTKQKKTFLQAHGLKIAAAAGLLVILGGLGGSFVWTRVKNQGETLDTSIAKGLAAVNADTREQYGAAVRALEHALKMDDGNPEALALFGYAHAMLYAEHGGQTADRDAAMQAFANPAARNLRPDLALVVDFLTADEAGKAAARQQLLGSELDKAIVKSQAGRLSLADKKYDEALAQLKKATELDPRNTRALVALGDYYLAFEDWDTALEMLSRAEALSKYHPARVIGHAEARLELGRELPRGARRSRGPPEVGRGAHLAQGPLRAHAGPRAVGERQARRGAQDAR